MKELFKKYKIVVRFVVLFLGSYLLLSILYTLYLKIAINTGYFPDYFTNLVARQSGAVVDSFGYHAQLRPYKLEEAVLLTIDNSYSVSIVEGCNSISIVILFVSFIIAFSENFKKTLVFLLAGTVLIYVVNILRIAILAVGLYKFPEYENILHSVIFPGIIYGMVFILWMIWVRMLKPKTSE
ncbi:exosortase family protein XrtF [Aequorivita capsosiphonis]|uniref:exosortase family protein XrtF n=1 Tax=Aequorivita capsosiphonis TaxID=487317 RepID=UPI0003F7F15C|nr:exosortase family protein XrtF [Aequorivita capsosiphonis]